MKSIERQLEEAGAEVDRKVTQVAVREPHELRRRLRYGRVGGIAGTSLMFLATIGLSVVLFTGGPDPSEFASQPSATDDPSAAVTFAQYEEAYSEYLSCLRDGGYEVEGPLQFGRDPNVGLVLSIGIDPTVYLHRNVRVDGVDQGQLDAADAKCKADQLGDIEQRWLNQESAKFIDEEAWIDNLLACAESNGMEIPETLSDEEMLNEVGTDPSDYMIMDIASEAITDYGCRPWEG